MVPSHGGSTGNSDTDSGSSMSTEECDSGLQHTATGVAHVGLLRVGAARHVIAALANGQVLMYRENGEKAWSCIYTFVVRHKCICAFIHMFLVSVRSHQCHELHPVKSVYCSEMVKGSTGAETSCLYARSWFWL